MTLDLVTGRLQRTFETVEIALVRRFSVEDCCPVPPRTEASVSIRPTSAVVCVLLLSSCAATPSPPAENDPSPAGTAQTTPAPGPNWEDHVHATLDAYFGAHPAFAVVQGRHAFDGRLPDWSKAGLDAEIQRLRAAREQTAAFPGATLTDDQKMERDYLVARMDRDLFWLDDAQWPYRSPSFYFDWMLDSLDPNVYVAREYAPIEERIVSYTRYARALPRAAAQIRANLRTPMPRTYVDYGIAAFGGMADYFEGDVRTAFAAVQDPALVAPFEQANREAGAAMRELATWLEGERAKATEDFALGPELFANMVRMTEGVNADLGALRAAGEADLARNLAALKAACAKVAPRKAIENCIEKVQADKPKGGAVEGARAQLAGLRNFLETEDLVSIPGTESALVNEAPPYNRQNFAYIDIPGPYEKGLPSTYYIAPPDPAWSKKVRDAYLPGQADLLFTSVHEIWPGHFLQFLHSNRAPSMVGRVFVGYSFAEGWAHYSEEMMVEAGLGADDPNVHVGQLLNALLRNVRYLSAIGLHTGGMTVAQSEALFREKGYQDAGNARQQAARGTYDPAYLNYTLGKLMIRKLRADWTASRGGRGAWKSFHDTVLSFGGPPVPMVRARMLGPDAGPAL